MASRKKKSAASAASLPARTALVVLGMHRSGTSALAGLMGHMGCDLPKDLMAPTEMNPKGFFESNRITNLNDEILASAGQTWFSFPGFPEDWLASPKADEFLLRALEDIKAEFGQSHLFVMKDPRICRLVPFWQRVLAQAECRPLYICTHRHPSDVAASLHSRYHHEPSYAALLWLRHVLDAEANTRGQKRVFTSYDRLLTDWTSVVDTIGTGLKLKWPRSITTAAPAIEAFLSTELRHFHRPPQKMQHDIILPEWVSKTYAILENWAETGENPADHDTLDQIRTGLNQAESSFSSIVSRGHELRQETHGLRTRLEALEQVEEQAEAHRIHHATEQKNRAAAEARIAELDSEVEQARSEAALREEKLQVRLVQAEENYRQLETKITGLEDELARSQAAFTEAEQALDQMQSALIQRGQEADDLHRQHLEESQRIEELANALDAAEAAHSALARRAERDAKHLHALTQQSINHMQHDVDARLERRASSEQAERAEQRYIEQIAEYEVRLSDVAAVNDELRSELGNLRSAQAKFTDRQEEDAKQITQLKEERETSARQFRDMETMLRSIQVDKDQERKQNKQLSSTLAAEKQAAATRLHDLEQDLHSKLDEAKSQRLDLERRIAEVETQREALLASRSWRMTAPVRRVSLLFRRTKS